MARIEHILSAIYPFAPHATIRANDDGRLIIDLNLLFVPETGEALPYTFDPREFDE